MVRASGGDVAVGRLCTGVAVAVGRVCGGVAAVGGLCVGVVGGGVVIRSHSR